MLLKLRRKMGFQGFWVALIRAIAPFLILAALVFTLILINTVDSEKEPFNEAEQQSIQLANFLQSNIEQFSLNAEPAYAQGQRIRLIGPPDGTLFEPLEPLTVHWSDSQPLDPGQTYVVAIAYYPQQEEQDTTPLTPVIEHYSTIKTRYQLPALKIHLWVPVMAWTVYVADAENTRIPIGSTSPVYRVLHAFNNPGLSGGYASLDNSF